MQGQPATPRSATCRQQLQQLLTDALQVDFLVLQPADLEPTHEVAASLNLGDPLHLYRSRDDAGATTYAVDAATEDTEGQRSPADPSQAAAQVPAVFVLHNFPRSFLQIREEAARLVQPAQTVDASFVQVDTSRRPLPQAQDDPSSSTAVPPFGVLKATIAALARCGNDICEFGEAMGTWGYPDVWHCPQDCPFHLHACPSQVRVASCPIWLTCCCLGASKLVRDAAWRCQSPSHLAGAGARRRHGLALWR